MIQAKAEADERIALAEKKIKELSKATIFNNDKTCLSFIKHYNNNVNNSKGDPCAEDSAR